MYYLYLWDRWLRIDYTITNYNFKEKTPTFTIWGNPHIYKIVAPSLRLKPDRASGPICTSSFFFQFTSFPALSKTWQKCVYKRRPDRLYHFPRPAHVLSFPYVHPVVSADDFCRIVRYVFFIQCDQVIGYKLQYCGALFYLLLLVLFNSCAYIPFDNSISCFNTMYTMNTMHASILHKSSKRLITSYLALPALHSNNSGCFWYKKP